MSTPESNSPAVGTGAVTSASTPTTPPAQTGTPSPSPVQALAPESIVADTTPVPNAESVKPNSDGSITLSAEAAEAIFARIATLETSHNLLLQVQDKNTVNKIEELRRQGKIVKSVKVRRIGTKYIVGWKTVEDTVYKDESGRLVEKQTIKIFFHDDSDTEMSMRQWASAAEYVPFEVKGEEKDEDGNLFFKIIGPDGLELKLNVAFIN